MIDDEIITLLESIPSYHRYRTSSFEIEEAIRMIHKANGISVLAHLNLISENTDEIETLIRTFVYMGLDGIEIYHPGYSISQHQYYQSLLNRYKLLSSGGSDFHGLNRKEISLGCLNIKEESLTIIHEIKRHKAIVKNTFAFYE